jgi:hypothetical protein
MEKIGEALCKLQTRGKIWLTKRCEAHLMDRDDPCPIRVNWLLDWMFSDGLIYGHVTMILFPAFPLAYMKGLVWGPAMYSILALHQIKMSC